MMQLANRPALKSYIERVNHLEQEKRDIAEDIRDIYAEAKANGYNPKAMRVVVADMRRDPTKAQALQDDVDIYRHALGLLPAQDLSPTALEKAAAMKDPVPPSKPPAKKPPARKPGTRGKGRKATDRKPSAKSDRPAVGNAGGVDKAGTFTP